jgi:hypothetical protein
MKKLILAIALLGLVTTSTGCRMNTQYGSCVGLANNEDKDPKLEYKVSTRNVVLSVIFGASLVWPLVTGAFWLWCPEGKKAQ